MANKLLLASIGACALFFMAAIFLLAQTLSLEGKLSALSEKQLQTSEQLSGLEANYSSLYSSSRATESRLSGELEAAHSSLADANAKINFLNAQLSEKELQLNQSRQDLEAQTAKVAAISTDLNSMEKNVNESIAWFRENARLPQNYSWSTGIFEQRILSDCVENEKLNLACIAYLMENTAFAIHYRTDSASSGKSDFLQSVKQTIDTGWGDCEDYSLIFKATLNSIKEKSPGVSPVAFTSGDGEFRVYPKESVQLGPTEKYWYVPKARGVSLGNLSSLHAYVVCYTRDSNGGHCTVALTEQAIGSSSEIGKLTGARVFEPQIGMLLGTVGENFGICSADDCYYQGNVIRLVIADNDLYVFQRGGEGWVGYGDYGQKIAEEKLLLG